MREAKPAALLVAAMLVFATASPVEARPRPAGHHHKSNFTANKTFGLGIMLGSPSGLSGKYFVGSDTAIDFGLGFNYCCRYGNRSGLHIHGDFLWHPISLVSAEAFELPFYVGVGFRFWNFADDRYADGNAFGIRVPFGLAFDFNNIPIDIFAEVVPVFDFFAGYNCANCGSVGFDFDGAIGFRYYFN